MKSFTLGDKLLGVNTLAMQLKYIYNNHTHSSFPTTKHVFIYVFVRQTPKSAPYLSARSYPCVCPENNNKTTATGRGRDKKSTYYLDRKLLRCDQLQFGHHVPLPAAEDPVPAPTLFREPPPPPVPVPVPAVTQNSHRLSNVHRFNARKQYTARMATSK